eukprot:1149472-Pelagomonas_calceolata.AAC.6
MGEKQERIQSASGPCGVASPKLGGCSSCLLLLPRELLLEKEGVTTTFVSQNGPAGASFLHPPHKLPMRLARMRQCVGPEEVPN